MLAGKGDLREEAGAGDGFFMMRPACAIIERSGD
jgi:hypothetical protein